MVGFLRGIVWGGAAAAVGLVVVSQLAGPVAQDPAAVRDSAAVPETATSETTTSETAMPDTTATDTTATDTTATDTAATGTTPQAPEQTTATTAATTPATTPATPAETAPGAEGTPDAPPVSVAEPAASDTPPPEALATAPDAPEGNTQTPSVVAPAVDAGDAPEAGTVTTPDVLAMADGPAVAPPAPEEPPAQPPSDAPADGLASPTLAPGEVADLPRMSDAGQPGAAMPSAPDAPQGEVAPEAAELPPPPPLTPEEEALLQPLPDAGATTQVVPAVIPENPEQGATLAPAPSLSNQAEGVVTGRLPRIGDPAPQEPEAAGSGDPVPDPEVRAADDTLPPLERFARAFDNRDAKPLFAILLFDTGAEDIDRAELAAQSLPLTIVIDPLSDGAADRAALWRAGGQEVVMAATGIPNGATATDLEQSFQVLAERLPEAVAVIDIDGKTFQDNRPLATQVVPVLAAQGRGLITFDKGLNAADQVARRDGLAATTVFRVFDEGAESSFEVSRRLDRAAFKASQVGQVAVLGALSTQTVQGVLQWAIEGKSSTVALAPVTALLTR